MMKNNGSRLTMDTLMSDAILGLIIILTPKSIAVYTKTGPDEPLIHKVIILE